MPELAESRIWEVSGLTEAIKNLLERRFPEVRVEGEISNFSRPASGHCYFTLKDEDAQLSCVLWRWQAEALSFEPEDGMQVRARGSISVYPPRGQYQLKVDAMQPLGEGELHKAFEALKKKLEKEGLFAEEHKRPIPRFPRSVGVITSGTGAAVEDILSTLARRYPLARVQLIPTPVQGEGAYEKLVRAIRQFNDLDDRPDVLIIGRGGGSLEDLWAFNEEPLARAIFASPIPVISAVGHETDFSISDFVADRRAATPSMAGEIAVPDQQELRSRLRTLRRQLRRSVDALLERRRQAVRMILRSRGFRHPADRIEQRIQRVDDLEARMQRGIERLLRDRRNRLERSTDRIQMLDPRKPLERGYSWITRGGTPIHRADDLESGDLVALRFLDGQRAARIEDQDSTESRKK